MQVADFAPDDLARLLAALGELRHRPASLLEAAAPRLTDTLIPLAQLSPAGGWREMSGSSEWSKLDGVMMGGGGGGGVSVTVPVCGLRIVVE